MGPFLSACLIAGFAVYMFWDWVGGLVCRYLFCPVLLFIAKRRPYYNLQHGDDLYMERYWLVKWTDWFSFGYGIKVHVIHRSDKDRALHDHPWGYTSLILWGGYYEVTPVFSVGEVNDGWHAREEPTIRRWYEPGQIIRRDADHRHRLEIDGGPCVTLFISRPKERHWGFYDWKDGKFQQIYWREYLNDWDSV